VFSHVQRLQTRPCPHLLLSAVLQPSATAAQLPATGPCHSYSSAVAMGQTDGETSYRHIYKVAQNKPDYSIFQPTLQKFA